MHMILLSTMAVAAYAAAASDEPPPQPVNRICPVSGEKTDGDSPITVVEFSGSDSVKRTVAVATCCDRCAAKLKGDARRYAEAALVDRKAAK
jgi:hypothetical protein